MLSKRWALVSVLWLLASRGSADQIPRIAVIHDAAADSRTIVRLHGELSTLGLHVVEVRLAPDEGASSLDDAARRANAFAAVRVVPAGNGIEVWVADRVTGKTLLRELVVGPGDAADDVAAIQAVELLRASLAELGLSPKQHGDVPASPAVQRIAPVATAGAKNERRLSFQVGSAMLLGPGGFGVAGEGFVGMRFRADRTWGVDAWTLLPILPASIEQPEGSAKLSPLIGGLDASLWIFEPDKPWQLSAAGGVAVVRLGVEGQALPPRTGNSDPLVLALPFGRLSLSGRLSARLALGLDAFVGVAVPQPIVKFDSRPVADWGRPMTVLALSLDVALD